MKPSIKATANVVGLSVLAALLVAWTGVGNDRVAADQNLFQLPTIRQFARQWPRPDLSDYPAASAPGWHLLGAVVSVYGSDHVVVLRALGASFGIALVTLLAFAAARRSSSAAWLALPLALSPYVLTSTVWLLPENAGWLTMTLALVLCLRAGPRALPWTMAITLAVALFVRQSNAWLLGVFAVAAFWLEHRRPGRLALAALAALPALAVLAWLVHLWHGLSPPAFQPSRATSLPLSTVAGGWTTGAPMTTLALLGLFGTPLLLWLGPARDRRTAGRVAVVGGVVGLVLGAVPPSSHLFKPRHGGFWNVVLHLPTVANRSPLVIGLALLGGMTAATLLHRLRGRDRWVLAAALLGFVVAQSASELLWQRYYEPFVLVWLALAVSAAGAPNGRAGWRAVAVGTVAVLQGAAIVVALRGGV